MRKDAAAKDKKLPDSYKDYISAGWLLSKMDLAGGKRAHSYIQGRAVTVGVNAMSFPKPVRVGDTVGFYADVIEQGESSITIKIESWAERRETGIQEKVTEGLFTFVAIDGNGRPTPINTRPPPGVKIKNKGVKPPKPQAGDVPPDENKFIREITATVDDENYYGDVFGGRLLEEMDMTGLESVQRDIGMVGATRGIEAMTFKKPVHTGEKIRFYTECVNIGRTSITMKVEAWAQRSDNSREKVTEGLFTYVALDKDRKPALIQHPQP